MPLSTVNNSFLCSVRVLILHQHFNLPREGGALRSYFLAKALADHGYHPVVITSKSEKTYRVEIVEGIEVHYLPIPYDNRFGFWKRGVSFLRYAWSATRLAGRIQNVTTCYAISVPLTVGLAAAFIKTFHRIPFIFEVGDLWPEAPIQMGFVKNYFLKRLLFYMEGSIYRSAQSIVALSEKIKTDIEKKVPGKKVHVIPNMADTEFYRPEAKNLLLQKKLGVGSKFVVSYIGAVGLANGLEFFLECAKASEKSGLPIQFLLCGDGAMVEPLHQMASRFKLKNLSFIPFRNRIGVREIMNVTDAIFVCYKPVPILETGSPNKYFDGLAAGKLIVINFYGWMKEEVLRHQCGISIDSSDPHDFVNQIQPFIQNQEQLQRYQRNARSLGETVYSRNVLSKQYVAIFEK